MPLGNHLCTYENIRFFLRKSRQNPFVAMLFCCCVQIHPQYPRIWKETACFFLDFFRPCPELADIAGATFRADSGRGLPSAACVAEQYVFSGVVRIGQVAFWADHGMPAAAAGNKCSIAPAVQEKHCLLPAFQRFRQSLPQRPPEYGTVALRKLLPHIRYKNFRPAPAACPFFQLQQAVFALCCLIIRGNIRRSCSHQKQCAMQFRQLFCCFPCVIFGRYIGKIAGFVCFVYDDCPYVRKRQEQGRARADDNRNFPIPRPFPLVDPFACG